MPTLQSIKRPLAAAAACLAMACVGTSAAAFDLFLKIDGIPGEATAKGHENEIDLLSWSWGVVPRDANRPARGACVQEITLAKLVDRATPPLLQAAALGTSIPRAVLYVRRTGEAPADFYTIDMSQVVVTSIQQAVASGQPQFVDQVSLRASAITVSYRRQAPDGSLQAPVTVSLSGSC